MRVTGKGETPWSFFSILINLLGSHAKAWNYEGEQLLRASSLDYTIVRPGVMGTASEPVRKARLAAAFCPRDVHCSGLSLVEYLVKTLPELGLLGFSSHNRKKAQPK